MFEKKKKVETVGNRGGRDSRHPQDHSWKRGLKLQQGGEKTFFRKPPKKKDSTALGGKRKNACTSGDG